MRAKGVATYAVDISRSLHAPLTCGPAGLLEPEDLCDLSVTDLVIHMNPPIFVEALRRFNESDLHDVSVVGYWVWELQKISDEWRDASHYCDAIWVPSPFVANTLFAELPRFAGDIRIVPHPVDCDPMPRRTPEQKRALREAYGIAPRTFVVGYAFAFNSNYARKNPVGVIDAFRLAFPEPDTHARLLLRCHDADYHPRLMAHLKSYIGGDDRIAIIDAAKQSWPMNEFYSCVDTYLSLHRSEGYGLQLAEAAQAGTAVIATGWGLAPDIARRPEVSSVDYRLVVPLDPQGFYTKFDGARWAEPDLIQAARLLTQVRAAGNRSLISPATHFGNSATRRFDHASRL
jgi:glycosyltransferase involved in cell wall biosynthesis